MPYLKGFILLKVKCVLFSQLKKKKKNNIERFRRFGAAASLSVSAPPQPASAFLWPAHFTIIRKGALNCPHKASLEAWWSKRAASWEHFHCEKNNKPRLQPATFCSIAMFIDMVLFYA